MLKKFLTYFDLRPLTFVQMCLGSSLMAFAIVNIHMQAQITEGGVIGLSLYCSWLSDISPVFTSPLLDISAYCLAFSLLGLTFIKRAFIASLLYAMFFKIFLTIGPIIPNLADQPWLAACVGGLLLGLGCGLIVVHGGAAGGDDAYALILAHHSKLGLGQAYMLLDLIVLLLSLTYIPFNNVMWSILTTAVSSFTVGCFDTAGVRKYLGAKNRIARPLQISEQRV